MRNVYTVGETVFDIIFKNELPVEAKPGGALVNTSVSLGRLGMNVSLVGDFANDPVGDIIERFLIRNNVSTKYITRYSNAKSRLLLAFLDDENNPDYSFYKIRKNGKAQLTYPKVKKDDIIYFGSFYSIKEEIRPELVEFLKEARKQKAIIVYDPNFRAAHLEMLNEVYPFIKENLKFADIIKGSDEDFENIYKTTTAEETHEKVRPLTNAHLVYTANRRGVHLFSSTHQGHYPARKIHPVSTVGAGDSFDAGMIYALLKNDIRHEDLDTISKEMWDRIIDTAIDFATEVCMSYKNYLPTEVAEKMKAEV